MSRWLLILVVLAVAIASAPAGAEVFKCFGSSGRVEYRDHPCDGGSAAGARVDTRANTIGSGDSLADIREADEKMARRMDARRAADERAAEKDREARDRAFYEERAHRDRQAIADAMRGGYGDGGVYWPAYVTPKHRPATPPSPTRVPPPAIVTKRKVS